MISLRVVGVCVLVALTIVFCAAAPNSVAEFETQEIVTLEKWIPQSGVYSNGAYFERFDTQNGRRVLKAVEFQIENYMRFYHGIEVLDDEPYRWNIFGTDPGYWCDCEEPAACDGSPDGSWIKSSFRLNLGVRTEYNMGAVNTDLGISVVGAAGPFDGSNDQDGPSGNWRINNHFSTFEVPRIVDPDILAEFTGEGFESTHMFYTYGGVGRVDCPVDGAESFNVDSSYDHFAKSRITCTYWYIST